MILLHPLPLMLARFCGIRLHWPSADELHTSADESCSQGKRKFFRGQTKVESDTPGRKLRYTGEEDSC